MLPIEKNKDIIEQINKLTQWMGRLKESKLLFIDFLTKSQQLNGKKTKEIKEQISLFEENLFKKSFHSIGKCKEMKSMMQIFKQYCTYLEAIAQGNIQDFKRVEYDSFSHEKKLTAQMEHINREINLYMGDETLYNRTYSEYDDHCSKLNQLMEKFKTYENPIHFYSLTITGEFSKNLDKKFQACENSETTLVNYLQVLDQKRKLLSENLKQIKEEYVFLLHKHMINIKNSVNYLIDTSKDNLYEGIIKSNKSIVESMENDVLSEEFQRFNDRYEKNHQQEDELFSDLKDLFGKSTTSIQINSDYKLFFDRCETFKNKKNSSIDETMYLQKKFLKEINTLIRMCTELEKENKTVQRQIFRSNGIDNFKKRFRAFFGQNFLSIAELCFFIVDNPYKRFSKIKKSLITQEQKLKKILHQKEEEVKTFRKRISMILDEHNVTKQSIQRKNEMSVQSVTNFKNSVEKSFHNFRDIVKEFIKTQSGIDTSFDGEIKILTHFIQKQFTHSFLSFLLSKDKEKYRSDIVNKININNQIILIVKEDTRYQVLFTEPLKPKLFELFSSNIDRQQYLETKKVLQKKELQSRSLKGSKKVSCCGMKQDFNFQVNTKHDCYLIEEKKDTHGEISISGKGIIFQQKSFNPFSQKRMIMIPVNEIESYELETTKNINGLEILTFMGSLNFYSPQNKQILANLQKNIGHKVIKERNESKRDKKNDTSSFLKHNSSTQFKISYDTSFMNNASRQNSHSRKEKDNILKQLIERWKLKNFLSKQFQFVVRKQTQKNSIREDFKFKDKLTSFLLKEKRTVRTQNAQNVMFLDYEWKISFPENSMFKSYRHSQKIKVELDPTIAKISIIEQHRQEENLFVRRKFYSEVQKMNKSICDFVVEICQREADVVMDVQKEEELSEQNIEFGDINLEIKESEKEDGRLSRNINRSRNQESFRNDL